MINFDVVNDIPTTNKTIFLLTDLNVPLDENGKIIDDEKIKKAMPTINYLVKTGARVVIATHLGYPASEIDLRFSTRPIADYLNKRMHCNVNFTKDCIGEQSKRDIFRTEYGDIIVLENLLFYKEEKNCDMNFARQLADGINVYVNDSFEYSNFPYASVLAVPLFVRATGGLTLTNTIEQLNIFTSSTNKFTSAIIGGKNFSLKKNLLNNLVETTKCIIVVGEIANTFLYAINKKVGKSIYEKSQFDDVLKILEKAKKNNCVIIMPEDVKTIKNLNQNSAINKTIDEIEDDDIIIDIGAKTLDTAQSILDVSRCVFWYGNSGISEYKNANSSTIELAETITKLTKKKRIFSIVSGKDTILSLKTLNYLENFSFVSTSTESTLQYLSGKVLPGIEVLKRLSKQMV